MATELAQIGAPEAARASAQFKSFLVSALLSLFIIGLHTRAAYSLNNTTPIPYAICILAMLGGFFVSPPNIPKQGVRYFVFIILVAASTIVLAPNPLGFAGARIRGFAYFVFTLCVVLLFMSYLLTTPRRVLSNIFLVWLCILLIGAILEPFVPLVKSFSDAIRLTLRPDIGDLDAAVAFRESSMGGIRPSFLASEPSVLALSISFLLIAWFLTELTARRAIATVALSFLALIVVRSPSLGLPIFAVLSSLLLVPNAYRRVSLQTGEAGRFLKRNIGIITALFVLLLVIVALLPDSLFDVLADRYRAILSGQDMSAKFRLVFPVAAAYELLKQHPLVGAGMGGRSFAADTMAQIINNYARTSTGSALGLNAYFITHTLDQTLFSNAFIQMFVFFGLAGTPVFLYFLGRFVRTFAPGTILFVFLIAFFFANEEPAFSGMYLWSLIVMMVGLLHRSWTSASGATLHQFER